MYPTAIFSAAVLAFSSLARAADLSLTTQLQLADGPERYSLLPSDEDFIFDFNKSDTGLADRRSFPALVGTNAAMALAELPGCSMVATHIHPRSSELFAVVSGRVFTESVPEAGVFDSDGNPRVIRSELGPLQMTVFHQGAFHTQMNPDCEPALAVASFSSEDPGAGIIVPQLLSLSDDVVVNSFNGAISADELDKIREAIPEGMAIQLDECRAKCGARDDDYSEEE